LLKQARERDGSVTEDVEWHLEVQHEKQGNSQPAPWKVVYSFTEQEYFPADFESANFAVYQWPGGRFWDNVICSKHYWLDSLEGVSIKNRQLGRICMTGAVVERHTGSLSELVTTLFTEQERANTLREIFGLDIPTDDLLHIQGRAAALGRGDALMT
jgi:arylamine N-acetyltransferase